MVGGIINIVPPIFYISTMSQEQYIIWKAIDRNNNRLLARGTGPMETPYFNNILMQYQTPYNSVVLEFFDEGCQERLGVFTLNKFSPGI